MELTPTLITLVIGITLDCLVGDPYWLPHPIRVYGHAIAFLEKRLNKGASRKLKGALCWLLLMGMVLAFFTALQYLLAPYELLLAIVNGIFFYYALSNRCLIQEALKVERVLNTGDLPAARKQLSMIVGRDTSQLSPTQIRAATVETTAENLSDGVIAPLFFFLLGGIPLMMAYKMVNTLDSMVGYKNERYADFGYVSAKLDDVANWIPARLTALLMVMVSGSWRALRFIARYGHAHSSPNAGFPEAALAGILDCRLGGASTYFGQIVEKPYIGENARELTHRDVIRSCWVNAKVAALATLILII
ncbi:MAG: adenosylcobinamide-phosphate synthase CbiB [Akkermansia sp.]